MKSSVMEDATNSDTRVGEGACGSAKRVEEPSVKKKTCRDQNRRCLAMVGTRKNAISGLPSN